MVDRSVQLGMGRFILGNLFSWRATDPRDLRAAAAAGHDIIVSATDQVIADAVRGAAVVVAGGTTARFSVGSVRSWTPSRTSCASA